MAGLSVIIITKNEALNIRQCLESIKWANEIIVVDSGSTDATVAICKEYTPHVYTHDWPGFGMQKNRALSYASKEWVLSLDADERLTAELRIEIEAVMQGAKIQGYEIPRLSSFCGRYMQHSGWHPDFVMRLFRRGAAEFSNDLVHERVIVRGVTGRLKHNLLHESFRDLGQLLDKMNHYSSAGAEMLKRKGREATLSQAISHGIWAFIRSYFLRAGFLDGREGFMLSVSTAEGTYYRYVKRLMMASGGKSTALNIIEPTLTTEAGHCHSFVKALLDASSGEDRVRLWANRNTTVTFDYAHVEVRKHFYRTLRRFQSYFLYRKLLQTGQKIFVSTASRTDLMLLSWAAKGVVPKNKVYCYFHWINPSASKLHSLKKLAVKQPNLVILGPTPSVVDVFTQCGFAEVRVVPYPITQKKDEGTKAPRIFKHLLYAGAARQDKGFKYLVDFIEYLHFSKSTIPVVIQTSTEQLGKCDAVTLADIARLKSIPYAHLTLMTEVLSVSEYEALYEGAIAIQLYKQNDFADRISGITLDAFSAGGPVISSSGTWIARMVERFEAGLVIGSMSPQDILSSAETIITNYERFHANASNAGQTLQKENDASMLYKVLTD
jgi:glycosyltransferase involved in cell wall biosynthesis